MAVNMYTLGSIRQIRGKPVEDSVGEVDVRMKSRKKKVVVYNIESGTKVKQNKECIVATIHYREQIIYNS